MRRLMFLVLLSGCAPHTYAQLASGGPEDVVWVVEDNIRIVRCSHQAGAERPVCVRAEVR